MSADRQRSDRANGGLVLYQPTETLTVWQRPLLVMVGEGPPSTSLIYREKDVDADLRRHDEVAPPKSRSQRRLVLIPATDAYHCPPQHPAIPCSSAGHADEQGIEEAGGLRDSTPATPA